MEEKFAIDNGLRNTNQNDRADTLDENMDDNTAAQDHLRRKMDRHLMPLVFVLYMLAFLDRGNIGNARIAGMSEDLHLNGDRYDWLLTIFYITYIIFEWSLLLWKMFPPHVVGALSVFFWGLLSTLQAAAQNWSGVMALRFFLGAFEAAYGPGVIYFLSFFYLRHEIGFRCGIFVSAAPLASTFAGALAFGITHGHSRLANWRLLFLVEGLPAILISPIVYWFLPDSPDKARFLTADERILTKSRAVQQTGTNERIGIKTLKLREVGSTMLDLKAWVASLMYFSANVSYASLPLFLPTVLEGMGYSGINAQGLSALPNLAAFFAAITMAWIADRTRQRGIMLTVSGFVADVGYVILATVDTVGVKYFATFLASAGVFSTIPNILAWTLNNQGSDSQRGAGLMLINLIGQCGPILGTRIYPIKQAPKYTEGMTICAVFMFFSAVLAFVLRTLLARENRKLDLKYGSIVDELSSDQEADEVAVENSSSPKFRFML